MGRSVGEKAAQAVAAGKAKATKVEITNEQAIVEIRQLRAGRLFVGNMEYVDKLLAGYDDLSAQHDALKATVLAEPPMATREELVTCLTNWESAVMEDQESHDEVTGQKLEAARNALLDMLRSAKANIAAESAGTNGN